MINSLPDDLLAQIFQWSSNCLKDVFTIMRVCLHWNEIINQEFFWKRFFCRHFHSDLIEPSDEKFDSSIMTYWRDDWYPYFAEKGEENCYVFKHFPYVLGCGVVTPYGFKAKNYKNLILALKRLKTMSTRYNSFHFAFC